MKILETEITIDATPQTVWSVMDDLERYPDWNSIVPSLRGRSTVGESLDARIALQGAAPLDFNPRLTKIVAARELRWQTIAADENELVAEHYFILSPLNDGRTHFLHCESFDGSLADVIWPHMDTVGRASYEKMNMELKERAEALKKQQIALHPAVDQRAASKTNSINLLSCRCHRHAVQVKVKAEIFHSHLCGCTRCWKPKGAIFALTAVVPSGSTQIIANGQKLEVVDASQSIQRHACTECGAHLYGKVESPDHHFYGLEFIHPELGDCGLPKIEFAGFVSSVIESGTNPSYMACIRARLSELGIPAFDAFSPELMDCIAWHKMKIDRSDQVASHTSPKAAANSEPAYWERT